MTMHYHCCLMFYSGCEDALRFYEGCGLGHIVELHKFGEPGRSPVDPAYPGTVSMARFEGPGVAFLAADTPDAEPMRGFCQVLMFDNDDALSAMFDRLADGGTVTTPLGVRLAVGFYGKLTDRFGVQWALSHPRDGG